VAELRATGSCKAYEKEYLRNEGRRVPVLVGAAAFDGPRDQGVCFVLDLTERWRAEGEARESERRYREAQAELAHVTRVTTLGELTASIAHEVNQPLAAVVANAGACLSWLDRETPNLEAARRSLEWIVEDSDRASQVIRRIRLLANKTGVEKVPLNVNDVVRDVIALVQRELSSHRVSLRTELAPTLPMILGDRVQLQQVIINLAMNGMEAMQSVTDRPRELVIRSRQDGGRSSARKCDGLRCRDSCRECGPVVQRLLHHQIQRHGYGTLGLPFDHGSPRRPAVGDRKRTPRCHVAVHPSSERRTLRYRSKLELRGQDAKERAS
jgi:signal transduction histidine kinase